MKRVLFLPLVSVVMTGCHKEPPQPAALRLRAMPGEVRWGMQGLALRGGLLTEHLDRLLASGGTRPKVSVDFTKDVTGEDLADVLCAIICGEHFDGTALDFSIAGHAGRDFRMIMPASCCDPRPFEPFIDEWGEALTGNFDGRTYMEFNVELYEEEFKSGGVALEADELTLMLMHRRRQAEEVTVHISIGSADTAGQLLPLLAACQNLEFDFTIGAEQREAGEREQRRLANLSGRPVPQPPGGDRPRAPCPPPDVLTPSVPPPLLPERWLMSCPDSLAAIRVLISGHGRG